MAVLTAYCVYVTLNTINSENCHNLSDPDRKPVSVSLVLPCQPLSITLQLHNKLQECREEGVVQGCFFSKFMYSCINPVSVFEQKKAQF